jgi:hypothetical protein
LSFRKLAQVDAPSAIIAIIAINSTKLMQLLAGTFAGNIAPSAATEADPTGRPILEEQT